MTDNFHYFLRFYRLNNVLIYQTDSLLIDNIKICDTNTIRLKQKNHLMFSGSQVNREWNFLGEKFQGMLTDTRVHTHTHTHTQTNYLNHWPTLNIASPDLHSAFQNWHDGVIWDSTPPLIASDEGMVDRWSHAQKTRCGSHRTKGLRLDGVAGGRWWGVYQSGGGQLFLICTKCTIISIKSFNRIILVQIWRLSAVDCSEKTKKRT